MSVAYLIDIWFRARNASNDALDKLRHLGHHIHPIQSCSQWSGQLYLNILSIFRFAIPKEFDSTRLRPVVFWITLHLRMLSRIRGTGTDDFAVTGEAADADDGGAV